jgi:hypothetical protein
MRDVSVKKGFVEYRGEWKMLWSGITPIDGLGTVLFRQ